MRYIVAECSDIVIESSRDGASRAGIDVSFLTDGCHSTGVCRLL